MCGFFCLTFVGTDSFPSDDSNQHLSLVECSLVTWIIVSIFTLLRLSELSVFEALLLLACFFESINGCI